MGKFPWFNSKKSSFSAEKHKKLSEEENPFELDEEEVVNKEESDKKLEEPKQKNWRLLFLLGCLGGLGLGVLLATLLASGKLELSLHSVKGVFKTFRSFSG